MIEKIAQLASIKLKKEEKGKLEKDFTDIKKFIEVLKEINIHNVQPTIHPFLKTTKEKEDKIKEDTTSGKIIKNAPEIQKKYFKIEKIL